jgi:hypothetical protein
VAERLYKSSYNPIVQTKVAKEQPIPFSHLHHVKSLGIDCRYCHTGVDQSGVAGIPPVKTCMSCHSQVWTESPMLAPVREAYETGKPIEWVKINRLPDHVYFNHSVHVNKGMSCTTCHGPVGEMPLVWKEHQMWMKWCLECHNNPAKFVQPKSTVTDTHFKAPKNEKEFREQLHLYDGNGQDLGLLINVEHENSDIIEFQTYIKSVGMFFSFNLHDNFLEPLDSQIIYYSGTNCIGTPYRNGYVAPMGTVGGLNRFFKTKEFLPNSKVSISSSLNKDGSCTNFDGAGMFSFKIALEEVEPPFTLPLVGPYSVR